MSAAEPRTHQIRTLCALIAILTTLPLAAPIRAGEVETVEEPAAEIAARAEASASELAGSVRALERSLRTAAPVAEEGKVLSDEENDALVEAGVKRQLAGLADELDQLSAALASGKESAEAQPVLDELARRAAALSELGTRPSRVPIPSELQAELVALWRDVEALSASRVAAPVLVADPPFEAAP